jgi:transcription termination factor Rho
LETEYPIALRQRGDVLHPYVRGKRKKMIVTISELESKNIDELQEMARDLEVTGYSRLKKRDLISRVLQKQTEQQGNIYGEGVLDIIEDGFGFLRGERYLPGPNDIYVSQSQIRRFGLRTGDELSGDVGGRPRNGKSPPLQHLREVNGRPPEEARTRRGA